MRKLSFVLAAFATVAVAAPTIASAQEFRFRFGGDREYYRDRDYGYAVAMIVAMIVDGIAIGTTMIGIER
jgi:hypothetical protein